VKKLPLFSDEISGTGIIYIISMYAKELSNKSLEKKSVTRESFLNSFNNLFVVHPV